MGRLLGVCVFAGLVCAQDAPVCTVAGTITDARSGAPVPKAQLLVFGQKPPSNPVVEVTGKFTLKLDRGIYQVTVIAEGYSRSMQLVTCALFTTLDFQLPPEALITGRVTDADGQPVPGASVSVLVVQYAAGQKRLLRAVGTKAGSDGAYRLNHVAAGSYYLLAVAPPDSSKSPLVDVPTYYPSAIEASAAAPIRVQSGELGGTDIRIGKARAFSVRGRLHVGDFDEPRNYAIKILPADLRALGIPQQATFRDNQGDFELSGVTPGAYTLLAAGIAGGAFDARLRINVGDGDVEGADLFLAAGNPVSGSLTADDKEQLGSLTARVMLYPLEDATSHPYGANATAGHFEFAQVALSQYRVVPIGLRQAYAKALRVDGRDSPDWTADLTASGPHSLEIVVGFDGGRVGGFARDEHGDPAPKKLVALVPVGSGPLTTPQFATTYSDDHGRYAFTGVQPGKYKLFAFEHVTPGAIQNRLTLRQFETVASEIEVQPNTTATADVNVIAASATATIE